MNLAGPLAYGRADTIVAGVATSDDDDHLAPGRDPLFVWNFLAGVEAVLLGEKVLITMCDECEEITECEFVVDPYREYFYNESVERWLCDKCLKQLKEEAEAQ